MASELELNDKRGEFIADYVLKSLKQKSDKFLKLWTTDETKQLMLDFFDKSEIQQLFVLQAPGGGALQIQYEFPTNLKSKACFFTKKLKESITRDAAFNKVLLFGDVSYTPLDQFSSFVDEVILPVLSNSKNQESWPSVISNDVIKHTNSLKHQTDVVLGQSKGKTLLPLPVGSEKVSEGDIHSMGEVPRSIIYAIETVVIEWAHQIDDVLSKGSSEQLIAGLNPTPFVELDYWKTRCTNLECIYEQLASPKVKKMATLLEQVDSTYAPPFKQIFKSVVAALKEAQNIHLYLSPLRSQFEELEQMEFNEAEPMIDPLLHVLCLVWAHCKEYRHPERIVVLLQEICNLVINCCRLYLDPKEIFKGEVEEAEVKVETALKVLRHFKDSFDMHAGKLASYFKDGTEPVGWLFASNLVFGRMDAFIGRIDIVQSILHVTMEFMKLEKVEISGIKGRNLSQIIVDMFEEFKNLFKVFTEESYDCLDPLETDFMKDYRKFEASLDDMDRRLASTVNQAFADCQSYDAAFKMINIFGSLLERPILKVEFDKCYYDLVKMLDDEMNDAKIVYDIHVDPHNTMPKIHKNMPRITGELQWCKEMTERVRQPLILTVHMEHQALNTVEFDIVQKKHDELLELLKRHEMKYYSDWLAGVDQTCSFNLSQPLLIRHRETMFIAINFDTKLQAVLREVKYLRILDQPDIPQSAMEMHSKNITLRKYINNIDMMVEWYNYLRKNTLTVEQPLIETELRQIDQQLEKAMTTLCWNSEGVWEYIEKVRDLVHDLQSRVVKSKENIETMRLVMSSWKKAALFERKEGKNETLLNLDDREDRCNKRYKEITEIGEKVHGLVRENIELLKADATSEDWRVYVDNLDDMVVESFQDTINCSMQYLIDQIENSNSPLFEVSMDLQANEILFQPSLDRDYADNFSELVDSIVTDIFKQASMVKRLAIGSNMDNYRADLEDNEELQKKRTDITERTEVVTDKAKLYQSKFDEYSNLWTDNREEFMVQFLRYGHVLTTEELEAHGETDISAFEERAPTLDQFKLQIDKYEKQFEEIEKMNGFFVIDRWFRIDCRKFRQAFLNTIKRWSLMFKQHLIDHVTNSLKELAEFIKVTDTGLNKEPVEGDFQGLVEVMGHLGNVKERQQTTDAMFEPLKQTIDLLKTYNQEMPEEVHLQLEELPEKWNNTKKIAITIKQTVAPLQNNEVANIRKKCASFDVQQHSFREQFRKIEPFNFSCLEHYADLDRKHAEISSMEQAMESLNESAALFEVTVPEFKQLRQCRKELRLLKVLWDQINVVNSSIVVWKQTLWKAINVDQMDQDCKNFAKSIRALDKEMRSWDAYTGVEDQIKNMMTSLRAVNELQNAAIRDRHWAQLMAATGVKFDMNDGTTLEDLLRLHLHNFEDEVRSIVEKAVKEMSMEKVLKELDATWAQMAFDHDKHGRTGITLLRASEELIEVLEEDQVKLQNMMTSKYISHFYDEVFAWQRTLSTADQVIQIWFEVQRTWSHLESIFIGSDDIRRQLPDDSARFDRIDTDFKGLVREIEVTTNVVKATTNTPRLYERLEAIQAELVLCEKALAEYLETKRLAFPRFYFVSSADLLDILSNGNSPAVVMKHLTKLFDSLARLQFGGPDANDTSVAVAMYAKDDEMVTLTNACDLSGQVEAWLNRLLDEMRCTMRTELAEAVAVAEEKTRDQWIFECPAQVALSCSQIQWGTEVYLGFARLEEGYENALKDFNKKQIGQLNALITLLIGELSPGDRQKVMTICTIDVHNRDVVQKLIAQKIDNSQSFTWLCQLRHRWAEGERDCFVNICDAQFRYAHEYLGNTPRLVITPLTDRCYITLTQSLHLTMSGAPAGPAGTGKTETTKDLGRALGIMVYVFNCSEQMDYKSVGNIYKGLAQSGSWGCFDEFNRISVEVLSVVAVQVKCIQDAIKHKRARFDFLGEEISLDPAIGIFITMNPGYAGRTELPENLKALFRPCAMVVPDFELICEIMLVAEGFLQARVLARKFITLYQLCKELLSKQDHYDWGLRAIKSVLVVAGALKRSDPGRAEDQVLMRALRDFNVPKIVSDDTPVFMGLIGDLFPALDVPRKRDPEFEGYVRQATLDLRLQPEENFILKVVQLQELFAVRHSVFVLGNAGTGKSMVWKTLNKTYANQKRKPLAVDLNPKAVTNDELFGIINPATREWKDGLFSVIMRDLANLTSDGPKWIVLDGDIDPMWIESLNTVMDDNKVLTLASNERIPLTPSMRLLFEISHLKTATPATVSRAGILYINPQDLGWQPFVNSWLITREVQSEQANLTILFDKYVPMCLEALKTRFKKITPIVEISHVQMLCYLLEVLLVPETTPPDCPKEWYELYFVFCAVWAFGSCMFQDQLVDHRVEFTKWWVTEFKTVKFPAQGTVFDYYIDSESKKFEPWTKRMSKFEMDLEQPLQAMLVPTSETTRYRYFLDLLIEKRRPVMLVGGAGTGKTVLLQDKLNSVGDNYAISNVPFNFYTTSEMLQRVLEKPLEKKAGRNYGPPGSKRLIYFIDDMNMPEVDKYFTVQPHTLIRQHIDYSHWYDRAKLTLKEIHNTQYLACMNPTAGSFTISPRLQRHFCVFALSFPGQDALKAIYSTILGEKLQAGSFPPALIKMVPNLVDLALAFHNKVNTTFLPTAIKFHYVFNLRDLSNIFQGLLFAGNTCLRQPVDLVRLWMHEGERVYCDKLIDDSDIATYSKLQREFTRKAFEDLDESALFHRPLQYCHFAQGIGEPRYSPVERSEDLSRILKEALDSYNEVNAAMNLVLFEDAVAHILRINRILESPRGYALLVGVGGSGKQSLSRLAAFISSLDVFQVTLRKGYGIGDLRADLAALYMKAGLKNIGVVFLLTDAQVAEEKFLVLVNDLLASGEILDLFSDDEAENIIAAMRTEVKSSGLMDSRENCWAFFINKVRSALRLVLCFSPVGATLRVRARKFPAVVNCTSIDWFHEWPEEALISVSHRFLQEVDLLPADLRQSTSRFMSFVHKAVNGVSVSYLQNERRYNYTTPKSFLEQIALYSSMLRRKHTELQGKMSRLENGLQKLESTAQQVDDLKAKLAAQEVELEQKNADANKLLEIVGAETKKVSAEKTFADVEEEKVSKIKVEVSKKQRDCEIDLAKAEPALKAAQEALNTLNKNNLTEMKSFGTPPAAVIDVSAAVMCLMAPGGKVPKDRSWKAAKGSIMGKVDAFLDNLVNYNKDNIPEAALKAAKEYTRDPAFVPEEIRTKSLAASGLCSWVINIIIYYEIFCEVKPKRDALEAANEELREASEKLAGIQAKIRQLEEQLQKLQDEFERARNDKQRCQDEADLTYKTIELANRLVGGLASENVRWAKQVEQYKLEEKTLPGDVLVTVAFLSYVGCFTKPYRLTLMDTHWLPFLATLTPVIPISDGLDPLKMLVDDAIIATWNNEGLPSDRMSIENATILTSAERWPLIIDPQLQGIKWIKTRYGADLKVVRLGQKGYLDVIEQAVSAGDTVLIENIEESMDPVLDHLLGRNTIKKGRAIRLGDKECEYNPAFRLILQTKLANPHYKPEMQAQATIINFTVTRDGLEDQLLATVVNKERADLETLKLDLTKQQNQFKITLKELEDSLLQRLSAAEGNFLGDYALVENLENNKRTAIEIEEKVEQAKITEVTINETRELYRPAAARASLLYFILNDLCKINPMYQFSLKAFRVVFEKAIDRAEPSEELKGRVDNLIDSVTHSVYLYTSRGLFEKDKLIFTAQMTFQILLGQREISPAELDFLLRFPIVPNLTSPVDFLSNASWGGIKGLSALEEFKNLDRDIEGSAKRWKKFVESETPEKEKFPQEWKNKSSLQRLCMMRALRPDRMTYAVADFVDEKLGHKYVEGGGVDFAQSFEESGPATPIFFILSPGVDPLKDVEALGRRLGFSGDQRNFRNISLGQGQEVVAESAMDLGAREGHWVVLQNIHLVSKWLGALEKKLEEYAEESHADYRVFISAEPAGSPDAHIIPQGILENAIKITNEPPTGMMANLHKALLNFNQETLEMCAKENEFKTILFALCYFHAVVSERRKFGPQGWNRSYPFNTGDLAISVNVLYNYLEANSRVPWEDLRYLFGEIMYGGHITDDWDRRLCRTYLEEFLQPQMLDGELLLAPGFAVPPNSDYRGYHAYIDECLPAESPYLYGLHPNAEIEFLTSISDKLFRTVFEMQPRDSSGAGATGASREERIKQILDEIAEKLPDDFNMPEIQGKVPPEERNPYVVVAFQECERMNMLTSEIRRSLRELDLGLKGELTITADMEALSGALFLDAVPESWAKRAYPSLAGLGVWYADLLQRVKELELWTTDFQLPSVIWLGGLFNPQSFLTAIMQQMARKNEWPLDRMALQCDVTKKAKEDMGGPPRDGAYVHGLFMEGARWDTQTGMLGEARLKELGPAMPVIFIKAIPVDRQDLRNMYACPVYKTKERGPTFVWTFNLKTKEKPAKWVLGGVALLLQV